MHPRGMLEIKQTMKWKEKKGPSTLGHNSTHKWNIAYKWLHSLL
jgi:hypothetical protein